MPKAKQRRKSARAGEATGPAAAARSRAMALYNAGALAAAAAEFRKILSHHPTHYETLHMMGVIELQLGHPEGALRWIDATLRAEPCSAVAYYNRGFALQDLRRFEEALDAYDRAVAVKPDYAEAHNNRGMLLHRLHRRAECLLSYRRALLLCPDYAPALHNLGLALVHQGEAAQAESCYAAFIAFYPHRAEAHYRLGSLYLNQDRLPDARLRLQAALSLQPAYAEALNDLGVVLGRQSRLDEAIACYTRSIVIIPANSDAHNNLGLALLDQGKLEQALPCLIAASRLKPDSPLVHYNLGTAYSSQNRLDPAVASYLRGLILAPDLPRTHHNLGNAFQAQGRFDEAMTCFDRALQLKPDLAFAYDNKLMGLNYPSDVQPEALYAAHAGYGERFEAPLRRGWPVHGNDRDPQRRVKIGYVSADFRLHSVAMFMEPILAHHDKTQVEVFCYYTDARQDVMTERLRHGADHWLPCRDMSDEALAAQIQADGIDVLVDLSGHTSGNRLPVFARKPAPVQVTYLGYPATTGLKAIDVRLVTGDTDPAGAERFHSERLYRLPRSLWCYRPAPDSPEVNPAPPAERHGAITFGSLNTLAKLSDATIRSWSAILNAVPGSRLALSNLPEGQAREHLRARFAAEGVSGDRLVLHGRLPQAAYYGLLSEIDIALDPYPYNGTTTTCQSLWMGLPVVSLIGKTSVARSGYALLKAVGLPELAGEDEAGYVAIAAGLAADKVRLAELRRTLRERMAGSALRDEAGFTREIEAAYRSMWRAWCQR